MNEFDSGNNNCEGFILFKDSGAISRIPIEIYNRMFVNMIITGTSTQYSHFEAEKGQEYYHTYHYLTQARWQSRFFVNYEMDAIRWRLY